MENKFLDRVAALLAKAESTDSEAERDALISKAQSLATNHAIDLAVARQHTQRRQRREEVEQVTIKVSERRLKTKRHFVNLMLAITRNNDVTCDIAYDKTYVVAYGFPSDIEVCRALFASLSVQMVDACEREMKKGDYKSELIYREPRWDARRGWIDGTYKPMDGRTFRNSFYEGFTEAISRRLARARAEAIEEREQTETAEQQSSDSSVALVLVGKAEEVQSFYKQKSKARGTYNGHRGSGASSFSGRVAGIEAGRNARIGSQPALPGAKGALRG